MSVWLRELAGWALLGVGLAAFAVCYFALLLRGRVVEAAGLGLMGITVFRGGMRLLVVAVAGRAATEAERAERDRRAGPKPVAAIRMPGPADRRP